MRLDVVITLLLKLVNFFQVLQSVQALVHPVRLQRLTIQPVNLLVSIHASLKLYIASDHTPLSFSLFERGPLCTTARQLVHALAMHYAAGALFRAGRWRMEGVTQLLSLWNATFSFKPACASYIDTRLVMFNTLNFPIHFTGRVIYNRIGSHLYAIRQGCVLKWEIPQFILTKSSVELWNDCTHGLPLVCGTKCSKTVQLQEAKFQNRFRLSLCHNLLFNHKVWLMTRVSAMHYRSGLSLTYRALQRLCTLYSCTVLLSSQSLHTCSDLSPSFPH